jgi:hypothetical protein
MSRVHAVVATCALLALAAISPRSASAQMPDDGLSPLQVSLACALPPATSATRSNTFHVIGAQDTVARSIFSERDLLIVDGGAARGIAVGQRYFVRRPVSSPPFRNNTKAIVTDGWIRIVAANQTTAIAFVERSCGAIETGDYLDTFAPPPVPADAIVTDRAGDPDFGALGRVLFGEQESDIGGAGSYMVVDRGTEQGLAPGARFAIYRNVQDWMPGYDAPRTQLPLTSIGEGVVVTTSQKMSVIRILAARDAVRRGDYVVPRPATR